MSLPSFVFSLFVTPARLSSPPPSPRNRLSFSLSLRLYPEPDSRSICDLEGFRAEAGHYGPLSRLGNTEYRGPILSAGKFIARSTLIGREIIGHSFSPSARSKRLSLIHDFSRIIAGPCHRLPSLSLVFVFSLLNIFLFLDPQQRANIIGRRSDVFDTST